MRERPYVAFRPQPAPLLPARFRIGELLGRGPGTEVYSAHDQELRSPVAVKIFPPDPDPITCRRVADEARALQRLSHDGLVSVLDGGLHRSRPYLVMQLIRGQSLRTLLRSGELTTSQSTLVAALLADALSHVHEHNVIHRDVKPSNILLDQEGRPYIGDFGIALLPEQSRLTSVDEVIGTPAYLAPEQVCGGPLTPAVDIYALGLVLLECLTGEMEYNDSNKIKAALTRLDRPPRIPTGLPLRLEELLHSMTSNEPTHRPTAIECTETLQLTLREEAAKAAPKPKPKPPAHAVETERLPAAAAAAAAAGSARARSEATTVYLARHARHAKPAEETVIVPTKPVWDPPLPRTS